jgi:hypothetical protein
LVVIDMNLLRSYWKIRTMRKGRLIDAWPVIILLMLLTTVACRYMVADRGPKIVYENHTSVPVRIELDIVPLDYELPHTPSPDLYWDGPIEPGQSFSRTYFNIPINPKAGRRGKYVISAIAEDEVVVWQKVFTWDELNNTGWKVVIESEP